MRATPSRESGSGLLWLFLVLFVIAAVAAAILWNNTSKLRQENQALRAVSQEAETLRAENEELGRLRAENRQIQKLKEDNQELLRLRGEVQQLRSQAKELETLRANYAQLQSQAQSLAAEKRTIETQAAQTAQQAAVLADAKAKAESIQCVNNLKQIGLAGRIWANDHGNVLPPDFLTMNKELNSPKVLICPADTTKVPVANWNQMSPANISYVMVSPSVPETDPTKVFVQCPLHGHVGLVDGSVQMAQPDK